MEKEKKVQYPLRTKLYALVLTAMVPFLLIIFYLLYVLVNYSNSYDKIVSNMTIANNYNLSFKDELDESIYKIAVGSVTFENIDNDGTLKSPYVLIDEIKDDFEQLLNVTNDAESRNWLLSLLRNIDTLKERVDDIKANIDNNSEYAQNIEMLDNNVYILTDLIQDDIQYYLYYQTKSMEIIRNELRQQVITFSVLVVIFTIIILLVEAGITGYTLNNIMSPIKELCEITERLAKGNFEIRAGVYTKDEVAVLAESFNDMARHLQVMVEQIKEDERKMRQTELRLLQEQINPHFLYNTLDTIVWLIECDNADKAVEVVVSLSTFFRLVLSKGREYITIREEQQHISSYLQIQQVRYRDILEYNIDIDQEIYEYQILKLTLQPLIENSLYHGIKYKRAKGTIYVTGSLCDDNIELIVRDTGVGMDEDTLAALNEEISKPCKETKSGFGLANVNERIRMYFGQGYGMHIESEVGVGTTIKIVIPAIKSI